MELGGQTVQIQQPALTQAMCRALQVLCMPVCELYPYVCQAALENPFLQIDQLSDQFSAFEREQNIQLPRSRPARDLPAERGDESLRTPFEIPGRELFAAYLEKQLGEFRQLSPDMRKCCGYLIGCLNSAGYLDIPLEELARESGRSAFELEQALYVVQMLDPPGVGARSLSECLLLQLLQGDLFRETNVRAVKDGLALIGRDDMPALAALLHVTEKEARRTADAIRRLNPIPSSGFDTGEPVRYAIPDAWIEAADQQLHIQITCSFLARIQLSAEYGRMIGDGRYAEIQGYLRQRRAEAKDFIWGLRNRQEILLQVVTAVAEEQRAFFLSGGDLRPVTMRQVARRLGLSPSTVSRAVKDKFVRWDGKLLPLKDFFGAAAGREEGQSVTAALIQRRIRRLIAEETPDDRLSDQDICGLLEKTGIRISRRTVAKYRSALGIAPRDQRAGPAR